MKSSFFRILLITLFVFAVISGSLLYVSGGKSNQTLKSRLNTIAFTLSRGMNVFQLYQNLANPYVRYVAIPAGLRKEQIADIYGKVLAWNDRDVEQFLTPQTKQVSNVEGYYFPSTYVFPIDATGAEVRNDMIDQFNARVVNNPETTKTTLSKNVINVDTAVKIGSLIQREAAGKQDMNLISGIIWNRIFNGMNLDIDATLQYAKGNDEDGWWPQVLSADKNIVSPYNTYKNKGLPPSAISNPSIAAIEAAYNPQKTNCIFYFHDANKQIHCSVTYADHVKKINQFLK